MRQPKFDYDLDYSRIDFRERPEQYRIGKGEQGVLLVESYKSEILPHWQFKTPELAHVSADRIHALFESHKATRDFVGMDMARKFLQMGFTRSRRCANHRSGRKWSPGKTAILPRDVDSAKAESASIFYAAYVKSMDDPEYKRLKALHLARTLG